MKCQYSFIQSLSVDAVSNDVSFSSVGISCSPAAPVLISRVRDKDIVRSSSSAEVVGRVVTEVAGDAVVVLLPVEAPAVVRSIAAVAIQNTRNEGSYFWNRKKGM